MKTWGMIILLCLAIMGCDEERCGYVQDGDMLVNRTICERIAGLEKKLSDEQQRNQEIIQLLLDYYGVKIKYISEHMELVPETGN